MLILRPRADEAAAQLLDAAFGIDLDRDAQHPLLLAAAHGQIAVRGDGAHGCRGIEVVGILGAGLLVPLDDPRADDPFAGEDPPQGGPGPLLLGDAFGNDVARPGDRLTDVRNLGRDEPSRLALQIACLLRLQQVGQRLQPPFAGDRGPRAAPGPVGQVEILELRGVPARFDPPAQFGGQRPLRLDRCEDGRPPRFEFGQPVELLPDGGHLHLVERTGRLLAVAADEGDGGAVAQQADGPLHTRQGDLQLAGDDLLEGGLRHVVRFFDG